MKIDELILNESRKQTQILSSIDKGQTETNKLLSELIAINKETLNFFVAVEERELGLDSTVNQEYLTEIQKDGFKPPSA